MPYFVKHNLHRSYGHLGFKSMKKIYLFIHSIQMLYTMFLKIKEVTPDRGTPNTSKFWNQYIKEVRNYNRTLGGKEAKSLAAQ